MIATALDHREVRPRHRHTGRASLDEVRSSHSRILVDAERSGSRVETRSSSTPTNRSISACSYVYQDGRSISLAEFPTTTNVGHDRLGKGKRFYAVRRPGRGDRSTPLSKRMLGSHEGPPLQRKALRTSRSWRELPRASAHSDGSIGGCRPRSHMPESLQHDHRSDSSRPLPDHRVEAVDRSNSSR